ELPSLVKEGWTRHQVKWPRSFDRRGRGGFVQRREALLMNSVRYASIYKEASRHLQTTPAAPAMVASRHLVDGRSHPSLTKEGSCLRQFAALSKLPSAFSIRCHVSVCVDHPSRPADDQLRER